MDDIIELRQVLRILRGKIWLILLVTVLCTLIAGVGSQYGLQPQYEATTEILLNSSAQMPGSNTTGTPPGTVIQSQITSNLMLIETYRTVILSPRVMQPAADQLGQTLDALTKQVSVDNVKDSQVLSIVAKASTPQGAVRVANTVAAIFQEQIAKLMKIDNVNVLTPAGEAVKVWPRPLLTGAIGFVFGLILSAFSVLLREYLDTRIRSEEQIEQLLGLPMLGQVPVIQKKWIKKAQDTQKTRLQDEAEANRT